MSSTSEIVSSDPPQESQKNETESEEITQQLENVQLKSSDESLEEPSESTSTGSVGSSDEVNTPRPLIVYSRKELINLSTSPLVKLPENMPEFKAWFGELEPVLPQGKKESELINGSGSGGNRRFRRDAEDGDTSSRPSFRSAMSQPSQMGNFKHQPLRVDRDRDERSLRNLSEKYDREKGRGEHLGLSASSALLRTRDREPAPHLTPARNSARKRESENGDDWRRAPDTSRTGRDDHNTRKDRDDRDRPRSRARDSSRSRISPPSRRDEKDREKRSDRDRTDDTFPRRDRDRDRFPDTEDDPWREGGKKDDRRRERFRLERDVGKSQDTDREPTNRDREAWGLVDDKDGRGQKRGGRDRRQVETLKEKEKDDRRDRDKDEPAWMETYVPSPSTSAGILGKTADGELDSIQAWKKDMKAREQRAKGLQADSSLTSQGSNEDSIHQPAPPPPPPATVPLGALDEIQQFKLMMRKEEEKRAAANSTAQELPLKSKSSMQTLDSTHVLDQGRSISNSTTATSILSEASVSLEPDISAASKGGHTATIVTPNISSFNSASQATPLTSSSTSPTVSMSLSRPEQDMSRFAPQNLSQPESNVSRFFPGGKVDIPLTSTQPMINRELQTPSASFDPPRQSRLLAFGAASRNVGQPGSAGQLGSADGIGVNRTPDFSNTPEAAILSKQSLEATWASHKPASSPSLTQSFGQQGQHSVGSSISGMDNLSRIQGHELSQILQNDNASYRSNFGMEGMRDQFGYVNARPPNSDSRSTSISLTGNERVMGFSSPSEAGFQIDGRGRNATPPAAVFGSASPTSPYDGQVQPAMSVGKGSRMAKHFERGNRDGQSLNGMVRGQINQGLGMLGREQQGLNAPPGNGPARNDISDLLTMLNNSAQAQRRPISQSIQGQGLPGLQPQLRSQQELLLGSSGHGGRHDTYLEPEETRFTANNLVPGLRPAHLGRSRDPVNNQLYGQLDDNMQMNVNRLQLQQQQQQQQRLLNEQLAAQQQFGGGQGPLGRMGNNFQQAPLRGGPSPINNFNPQGMPQQRLPPGLANLGGRPPHEPSPSQFIGGGNFGMPSQNMHSSLLQQGASPQSFNQLQSAGLGMGASQSQMRGGPPGLQQHLSNVAGGGTMNGMEFRGAPNLAQQNQLLGLGGSGLPSGMRGAPGFNSNQHLQNIPQQQSLAMRQQQQQQQQQLPPHLLQQMLGSQMHMNSHNGGHDTSDLMTLLMRGANQE